MKIQLLLTILLLSTTVALYAQPSSKDVHPASFHNHQLHQHQQFLPFGSHAMPKQEPNYAAKTTAGNASRCIAQVNYNTDATSTFIVTDSFFLIYSGSRGNYKFDSAYGYVNNAGTYTNKGKYTETFDANNNVTFRLIQSWVVATSSWGNYRQNIFTYDTNNNMLTELDQNWDSVASAWINSYQYTYTYDANNNRISETGTNWNTVTLAWDNVYKNSYTYDGLHNKLYELDQYWTTVTSTWANNSHFYYTYTTANKVATKSNVYWNTMDNLWIPDSTMYIYTYNAINNPIVQIQLQWDSSAATWAIDTGKTIYTYDGFNNCTFQTNSLCSSGIWNNINRDSFSNFASGIAQMNVLQIWNNGNWNNQYLYASLQNSFSQPIYEYRELWDTTSFTFKPSFDNNDYAIRYYYEFYYSDVQSISNNNGTAYIYPIPAKNTLTLDINWDAPQAFAVTLFDMQGRIMKKYDVATTTQYKDELPINDLPTGTYILNIEGASGKIVKQIVIAR